MARSRTRNIITTVNGREYQVAVEPETSLAEMLRELLGLTGTHTMCDIGACGVCTVLVDGEPIRACLELALQVEGKEVETVESLADGDLLSPLQREFVSRRAFQCGYCTPGFLMLGTWMLRDGTFKSLDAIRDVVSSNICRCTGYIGIVESFKTLALESGDTHDS